MVNYKLPPKFEPEPEPAVKLKDYTRRNDSALEKLLEELVKNMNSGLDKSDETK